MNPELMGWLSADIIISESAEVSTVVDSDSKALLGRFVDMHCIGVRKMANNR